MAGLGPLRQVAHLSGRVPVLEGLEPSQLTPHHSGRPEELTTTDWSYSSPKPEAAPGRLHLATVLPRDTEASPGKASQAVTTTLWSYFFFLPATPVLKISRQVEGARCAGEAPGFRCVF